MSDLTCMTPVFCTANVPTKTIDLLIERSEERNQKTRVSDYAALFLVTSKDLPASTPHAKAPVKPFESPYLGASLEELREEFLRIFGPKQELKQFHSQTFIVLDERSARDNTCMIVSCSVDKGEARSDFYVALEVLISPEMGSAELNEGIIDSEWEDSEGGGILYTIDRIKEHGMDL